MAIVTASPWVHGGGDVEPRPPATSLDHSRLLFYVDEGGHEQPVRTAEDWGLRRRAILAGMQEAMGPLPDRNNLPPLDMKVTGELKGEGFTRLTISFVAEKAGEIEERVPAYMYLPDGRRAGERRAAVLALHQTSPLGKGDVSGAGAPNQAYGLELAKRGYVVLCPDYPSFGDYKHYDFQAAFRSGRYASGTIKGVFNHMRCVDLLQSRQEVDGRRIGVIGHSLGGHNAMFVAAFDERIKAVVASCGWTPFADYYGGKIAGWTSDRYMPRLRDVYKLDPKAVPFDFHEVVAALAPRPFFSNSPLHDGNFDVDGVRKAIAVTQPVYELVGAPKALQVRYPDCGHDFPPEIRAEAYAFLDAALKVEPPAKSSKPKIPNLKDELPRIAPHEPREALATFKIHPGFRIEQVAAEPLVQSPVACDFDENGRLFVCEMVDYPGEPPTEPLGRVNVLEDTDGDGAFDRSTILAERLPWPTAILCYDGGVFVGAAPDILYLKDTDGDGRADVRKVVFTGFLKHNVQGLLNSFRWGLDNRVHGATSVCGGLVRPPEQPESQSINLNGRDFSFDPRKLDLRSESGGAQHGMSFDDWGRKFVCSNSDHIQMVMFEDRHLARNPHLAAPSARESIAADGPQAKVFRISPVEPWRIVRTRLRVAGLAPGPIEGGGQPAGYFTGATGTTIYRGDAFPAEYRGQAFVGDVGSNLVHRKVLELKGVGFVAKRVDEGTEFLASSDNWFRPSQFANAPDGSLYVLDTYREVIEHPASLPEEIKRHLDLTSGRHRGRLYRIVPEAFAQRKSPELGKASTEQLVATLEHRNGWHRDTAARLLFQRQERSAIEPLLKLAAGAKLPEARMHALYALSGLGALPPEAVGRALGDEHPRVREHAVRLAEAFAAETPEIRKKLAALVDDPDVRVRYQLAFTAGFLPDSERPTVLSELLRRDAEDAWMRLAVFSSLSEGAGQVLTALAGDAEFRSGRGGREAIGQLAQQIGSRGRDDEEAALLRAVESLPAEERSLAYSLMKSLSQGLARSGSKLREELTPGGKAEALLRELLDAAAKTAVDPQRRIAERVDAVRTLGFGTFADSREILNGLLDDRHPQEVQLAAVATLDHFAEPEVGTSLLQAWPRLSPRLRTAAADALFARPERLAAMLDAVEKERIPASDVDLARLKIVEGTSPPPLDARIRALIAKAQLGRRQDVVDAYKRALALQGDPVRGKAFFQKTCVACHRLEGVGFELGPNLASMQQRGPEAIMVNVLDPNREVNPQFVDYVVTTRDGRTLTGILDAETATSVTLKRAEGATDTVLRADINKMRSAGLSLMPEGLEQQLDAQGMADLIAYIMSAK